MTTPTPPPSTLDAALTWAAAGCSVIPIRTDGSKAPAIDWKQYQQAPADEQQIRNWFSSNDYGIGIACGAVSGHLEMIEFEGRALHEGVPGALRDLLADHGQDQLWTRLLGGYMEQTPSGGLHLLYRVQGETRGNLKLARRPATPAELVEAPRDKVKVLIETRGEGGQVVVAPTGGHAHATGRPWVALVGTPATIPTIPEEDRDNLHAIASLLDLMPAHQPGPQHAPLSAGGSPAATSSGGTLDGLIPGAAGISSSIRPGDDFNARASWDDILSPHGWTRMWRLGKGWGWRRPGKSDRTISASTGTSGDGVDRLYVFSSSTEFDTETPYSKFGAHALLEHQGDHAEAARQLRRNGYGSAPVTPTVERPAIPAPTTEPPPPGRHLRSVTAPPSTAATAAAPEPEPPTKVRTMRHSDDGNACALIDLHGDLIRYDQDRGRWLLWGGYRWLPQPPGGGAVRELVKDTAYKMPTGSPAADTHQKKSLSAAGVSATLQQAATDPRVVVTSNQLDADPWILNTPDGIIDLRTSTIRPGTPDDLVTRVTIIGPDFDTPPPAVWTDFLHTTFGGDTDLTAYVQRLAGLALIGVVREQILGFWYGAGANGKSTLLEVLMWILRTGDDGYATAAPSEMLMVRKHEPHSTELAQLAGRRLVVCSELEDGQRLAEARVKLLTGRDAISARFLYGQPFTFNPSHTIILAGNHQPQTTVGGPALWRRLRCVPFNHVVPVQDRDPALPDKLQDAGAWILAWAVRGAADYLANGMREPAAVRAATAAYEADQDTVGRFVNEQLHMAGRALVGDLRKAYEKWCSDLGLTAVSARRLTETLEARWSVKSEKGAKGARFYVGVSVPFDEDEDNGHVTDPDRVW